MPNRISFTETSLAEIVIISCGLPVCNRIYLQLDQVLGQLIHFIIIYNSLACCVTSQPAEGVASRYSSHQVYGKFGIFPGAKAAPALFIPSFRCGFNQPYMFHTCL